MMISLGLTGAAVLGQALVPSYAAAGVLAPILMLTLRLVVGFGLGGEVGPSTAYLVEAAPVNRRGFRVPAIRDAGSGGAFPKMRRSTALAIVYALGISLFGGTTQFVVTWLIDATGNPLAPAYDLVASQAIWFAAALLMVESSPLRVKPAAALAE
jgi:MFS family permease